MHTNGNIGASVPGNWILLPPKCVVLEGAPELRMRTKPTGTMIAELEGFGTRDPSDSTPNLRPMDCEIPNVCRQNVWHTGNSSKVKYCNIYAEKFLPTGSFLEKILLIYKDRNGQRREGEKHQCVVASPAPPAGVLPASQAWAVIGNDISHLVFPCLTLIPLIHNKQNFLFSFQ